MTAKDIRVAAISSRDGNAIIQKLHYSHKTVKNSQLHLGVFLGTRLKAPCSSGRRSTGASCLAWLKELRGMDSSN